MCTTYAQQQSRHRPQERWYLTRGQTIGGINFESQGCGSFKFIQKSQNALNKKIRYKGASRSSLVGLRCKFRRRLIVTNCWLKRPLKKYASKFPNIKTTTGLFWKLSQFYRERAVEKDMCCLSVVYALMVDCQLKVRMARPGQAPFIPELPL